jgi:3-phenylpropionate/cinnamic acid dioxygenase small subunit
VVLATGAGEFDPTRFLYREARLLDAFDLNGWLQLIDRGIEYKAPVRQSVNFVDGSGISRRAFYFNEDYGSLSLRIKKLQSEFSWAENPRTRTRRMVSNVEVIDDSVADEIRRVEVISNLVVFCHRGDEAQPRIISAQRQDLICVFGATARLLRRNVLLDTTVLGVESLSIFL